MAIASSAPGTRLHGGRHTVRCRPLVDGKVDFLADLVVHLLPESRPNELSASAIRK